MSNEPTETSPGEDHQVQAGASPSDRPTELQARVKRFAAVRSAERAMAVSVLALQDDACVERAASTRKLLEDFITKCDANVEFPEAEWEQSIGAIDKALDRHAQVVLEFLDGVTMAQLRSTMPSHTAAHRPEVLSLVHLALEDTTMVAARIPCIEYLLTLLSTVEEDGQRKIAYDPAGLSPIIEAYCRAREAEFDGDVSEIELQFHQAAAALDPGVDPGPVARELRTTKTRLRTMCLVPGILRAIVTYNTRMANVMERRSDSAREVDADFRSRSVASDVLKGVTREEDAGAVGAAPDFADPSLKAAAPPNSVFSDNGLRTVVESIRRRIRGQKIGSCTSERVALALDLGGLEDYESAAITAEDPGEEERLLAYTIVAGLLFQSLPTLGEQLDELGITPKVLGHHWINEINEDLQVAIKGHLQGGDYEAGCRLSESKTRFLYSPLSTIAREAAAARARGGRPGPGGTDLLDAAHAAANQVGRDGAGSRATAGKIEVITGWRAFRQNVIKFAMGAAVAALVMNFISSAPQSPFVDLEPADLEKASSYLGSAYRDGHGVGKQIVGRSDPDWDSLDADGRYAAARKMVEQMTQEGVTRVMIFDDKRRLVVHAIDGDLRLPVDPALAVTRVSPRDVQNRAREAHQAERRRAIEWAEAAQAAWEAESAGHEDEHEDGDH